MSSRNSTFHRASIAGALLMPLRWILYIVAIVVGLFAASWIVDWAVVTKLWEGDLNRLQNLLIVQYGQLPRFGEYGGAWQRLAVARPMVPTR